MNFSTQLKTRLNGLKEKVERSMPLKEQVLKDPKLTEEEKKQRLKALRDERVEKLNKATREISDWLWQNKIDPSKIKENEPKTSKAVAEAQRHQTRAKERLREVEDPEDVTTAVKKALKDETVSDGYKTELWKMAKTKIDALGIDDESYHRTKMQKLRRKHLLDDETVGKIRKTEAIEDIKPMVTFIGNHLRNQLEENVFPELEGRNPELAPDDQNELSEKLDKVYNPAISALQDKIESHKPKSKQNAG